MPFESSLPKSKSGGPCKAVHYDEGLFSTEGAASDRLLICKGYDAFGIGRKPQGDEFVTGEGELTKSAEKTGIYRGSLRVPTSSQVSKDGICPCLFSPCT